MDFFRENGTWITVDCRYVLIFLVEQVVDTRRHFYEKRTVMYCSARDLDDEMLFRDV